MTLEDILSRLKTDGYIGCNVSTWSPKCIHVPNLGEIELAHGEAKIFDDNFPNNTWINTVISVNQFIPQIHNYSCVREREYWIDF